MSETGRKNGNARTSKVVDRRSVLKSIAVTGIGAGGIGLISDVARAEGPSEEAVTCGGCSGGGSGTVSIPIRYGAKEEGGSYAKDAKAAVSPDINRQRAYVMTGGYGSGYAKAQLWGWYTPVSDGYFDITVDYNRNVEVNDAQLTCNAFARYYNDTYGGMKRKTVEVITTSRVGTVAFTENFHLKGNRRYEIGLEIIAEGSSNSVEGDIADAYTLSQNRRVKLREVTTTSI